MSRHDLQPGSADPPVRGSATPSVEAESEAALPITRRGGRPKAFSEETVKVALFLPPDLIGTLKAMAARRRLTPSRVVAEWIEKAEIREGIARGLQDFEKGDVLGHDEALRRLAKW